MAMTAKVKDELSRLTVTKPCCRKAEVSAMLRFAGGLHIISGRIVIEAELDTASAARRLRRNLLDMYGTTSELVVISAGGLRRTSRYVVRVEEGGEALARQTGLIDLRGRPVRGLPPRVVNGATCDAEAAWRGAFLAHGSLTEPGRSSSLEVTCPGPEAALALVGSARRLGISAKAREVRGVEHAQELRAQLEGLTVSVAARVSEQGHLFGAVTASDVAVAVKKAGGPTIDKRAVSFAKPVKSVGSHTAAVKLHSAVTAHVPFAVVAQ